MNEYVYRLILEDRLFSEDNWTPEDEEKVGLHFAYLKELLHEGILILAGKTAGLDESTYGLVFFTASSLEEAQEIMNHDPAIQTGIMSGTLHEYNIALYNNAFKKD